MREADGLQQTDEFGMCFREAFHHLLNELRQQAQRGRDVVGTGEVFRDIRYPFEQQGFHWSNLLREGLRRQQIEFGCTPSDVRDQRSDRRILRLRLTTEAEVQGRGIEIDKHDVVVCSGQSREVDVVAGSGAKQAEARIAWTVRTRGGGQLLQEFCADRAMWFCAAPVIGRLAIEPLLSGKKRFHAVCLTGLVVRSRERGSFGGEHILNKRIGCVPRRCQSRAVRSRRFVYGGD